MSLLRVATDSTADVPAALAADLQISVIPCQVFWGEEVYRDGVDLTPRRFYEKLARSADLPKTSQPPVSRFVEAYRRLLETEGTEEIVSIHVAGNLSGTVNAAWAAAQAQTDPSCIEVIDSGQVSMGMGWAVIAAARMARSGATRDQVTRAVRKMLPNLRAAAMIDTLDNLYKGGRINQVTAALGTVLQVKPLILVQEGQVRVTERVRTRSRALKRLVAMVQGWGPLSEVAVLHADAEELARELASMIRHLAPYPEIMVEPAGLALTTHLGLGAVGVCAVRAGKGPKRVVVQDGQGYH